MNNSAIEKSLARAMNEAPSPDFDNIAYAPITKMTEHDYITRQLESRVRSYYKQYVAIVSFCAVLLLVITGWFFQYRMTDSVITLDVNPSIKIVTNRKEKVLSVSALNADAQKVLDNLDESSSNLNNSVASIVTSIIQEGYMKDDKNVIMISVENKNSDKAVALVASLRQIVKDSALSQNITPLILKQTFQKDKDENALAEKYHISVGKLRLLQQITGSNKTYSIDKLTSMSMEELIAISKKSKVDLQKIIEFDDCKEDSSSLTDEDHNASQSKNNHSHENSKDTGNDRTGTESNQRTENQSEDKYEHSDKSQKDNYSSRTSQDQEKEDTSYPDNDQDENSENSQEENKSSHIISGQTNNKSSQSENDQGEDDKRGDSKNKRNPSKSEEAKNSSAIGLETDAQDFSSKDNNSHEASSLSNLDDADEDAQTSEDNQLETGSDVTKTDEIEKNPSYDTQWEDDNSTSGQESD
jgi:hypothetical protein